MIGFMMAGSVSLGRSGAAGFFLGFEDAFSFICAFVGGGGMDGICMECIHKKR